MSIYFFIYIFPKYRIINDECLNIDSHGDALTMIWILENSLDFVGNALLRG